MTDQSETHELQATTFSSFVIPALDIILARSSEQSIIWQRNQSRLLVLVKYFQKPCRLIHVL
jgi:hypothetical protein